MKKAWDITVNDKLPLETQKKIKRVLRPTHPDILHRGPQKCLFCGELTTWAINDKPVCPKCAVQYNFLSKLWLPNPCEVCGKQGEWSTDDWEHSLCYLHRDEWFHWTIPELQYIDQTEPEKWKQAWKEGWDRFIKHLKNNRNSIDILQRTEGNDELET